MRGETERVRLRSKLGECPKMMVGMLLESCGKKQNLQRKNVEGVRVGKGVVRIILGEIMAGASGAAAA